ncbi:hypothetical protein ACH5RR_023257 [Cinchona calisaya]|uniref:Uncharacterized protein n=1 Tax=Cinchona calisaya TaxID=153742 RepID=A0ABD2ZDF6_9GENT
MHLILPALCSESKVRVFGVHILVFLGMFVYMKKTKKEKGSQRNAILHPGLPEDFALQTVQEAVKPQKQTKLAQDENQLLENILRRLLQELVKLIVPCLCWLAAVQTGEKVMQYEQSIAEGENTPGQIPRLLDIVLYLCEQEHIESGMIFQLLEDLTEMSTMKNCEDLWCSMTNTRSNIDGIISCESFHLKGSQSFTAIHA